MRFEIVLLTLLSEAPEPVGERALVCVRGFRAIGSRRVTADLARLRFNERLRPTLSNQQPSLMRSEVEHVAFTILRQVDAVDTVRQLAHQTHPPRACAVVQPSAQ